MAGVCMTGRHAWQGGMCGRMACMAGGMHGREGMSGSGREV